MTSTEAIPTGFQGCPVLGVGLGLRRPLLSETLAATDLIDWLEFTPENYIDRGGMVLQGLQDAKARFPLVSHGVSLSIGSTDPWNEDYLAKLEELFDQSGIEDAAFVHLADQRPQLIFGELAHVFAE